MKYVRIGAHCIKAVAFGSLSCFRESNAPAGSSSRCVSRCDNNVCEHMSIIPEFDNSVAATFSLTAQTSPCHRDIQIMCEDGEILADDGKRQILVRKLVTSPNDTFDERIINIRTNASGHGGSDAAIMEDFTASLRACAIEKARLSGTVVYLEEYREEPRRML